MSGGRGLTGGSPVCHDDHCAHWVRFSDHDLFINFNSCHAHLKFTGVRGHSQEVRGNCLGGGLMSQLQGRGEGSVLRGHGVEGHRVGGCDVVLCTSRRPSPGVTGSGFTTLASKDRVLGSEVTVGRSQGLGREGGTRCVGGGDGPDPAHDIHTQTLRSSLGDLS